MKHVIALLTILLLFTRCGDFLDMVPEKDIVTFESIFEKRETADQWITTIHAYLLEGFASDMLAVGMTGADELVTGDYLRDASMDYRYLPALKIGDGLQMSQEPYCNMWMDKGAYKYIRMCNTFLESIHKVYNMEEAEKAQWAAEVKAIKAFYYFELVRRYGPIILVPENIGVEASLTEMQRPRSHVDTCFKAIVDLLDEAIPDLLLDANREQIRRGYFCKESAMALKAKALLYAASPLFNGNEYYINFKNKLGEPLFSTSYDPEKWKLAAMAADEAVELCEGAGRKLIDDRMNKPTKLQNTMDNIEWSVLPFSFQSKECLFAALGGPFNHIYKYILPLFSSSDPDYNMEVCGGVGASMKMVEMFYTENGLPIESDKTWDYAGRYQMAKENSPVYQDVVSLEDEVLSLHLRREPRFYADIAADRCYWRRGPDEDMSGYKVEARKGEKFGILESRVISTVPQNLSGYWVKKMLYSDVSTAFYGDNMQALGQLPFPVIRLAELYLIQAEAWNEYEGPQVDRKHVYEPLNKVRARAGIPDVETSWGSYSKTPEKVRTKEGMREIIRREINIEFAFEGHRFWNLRRWKEAHNELNSPQKGWNVFGETAREFYNNFEEPVVVWNKRKFVAPRDYLFPIKGEEVLVSGCVQNPGW